MKRIVSAMMVCLMITCFSLPVSAKTYSSAGQGFTASWELADGGSDWLIKYGFNTFAIHEDYTHTYHSTKHHVATVTNSNGAFSDEDGAGKWAGIEVTHSGNSITYSISY